MLSPFPYAVVVNVVTEFARDADVLVLMGETMEELRNKFVKWKKNFEGKCWKVNRRKTKVMVSSSITKDGLSRSKPEACEVCPRKMCRSVTAKI